MSGELQRYDESGDVVAEITTDGDTIKPFINSVANIVDEAIIEVDASGLHIQAVDVSNVILIHTTLHADAFESFDVTDSVLLGANISTLRGLVRRARMNHDDALELKIHRRSIGARVSRGYEGVNVVTDDSMKLIDPDSLRERPTIPDLEREHVELPADAFEDAIEHTMQPTDTVDVRFEDGDVVFESIGNDTRRSVARFEDMGVSDGKALLSTGMLTHSIDAVMDAKPETVTLGVGDEFPILFDYQRVRDDDVIMSGEVMQAPRIRSDD